MKNGPFNPQTIIQSADRALEKLEKEREVTSNLADKADLEQSGMYLDDLGIIRANKNLAKSAKFAAENSLSGEVYLDNKYLEVLAEYKD